MQRSLKTLACLIAPLATAPLTALAEQVYTENVIVDGNLCAGAQCISGESFDTFTEMKIKSNLPGLEFADTSTGTNPSDDWRLFINDGNSSGYDRFSIENLTDGVKPFTIIGGAPDNALVVAGNGYVGTGTLFPQADLHVTGNTFASFRLEDTGSGGGTPTIFDLLVDEQSFYLRDPLTFNHPLRVNSNAHDHGLVIDKGTTGIGTLYPQARLHIDLDTAGEKGLFLDDGADFDKSPEAMAHIHSETGSAMLLIEEDGAASNPRTLLNLQNNGRPEIVMGNTATGGEWAFGAGNDFFLKVGTVGSTSGAKTKVFTVKGSGDAILAGSLTTGGTTCGGGCDAVFSDDYDLPSIAEHAAQMRALGYLPNVGPTPENAPLNVTDKLGRMLNELEHAHLYIARLEARDDAMQDRLRAQEDRSARLESALEQMRHALSALTRQVH